VSFPPKAKPSKSRRTVVFVTFETEFAKSGGLGAVMGVLPRQMAQYETCFMLGPHFESITDLDRLAQTGRIEAFSIVSSFDLPVGRKKYAIDVIQVTGPDGFKTFLLSADGFFTAPVDPYLNPRDPTSPMDPDANPNVPDRLVEDALFFCAAVPRTLVALGVTQDLVLQLQDWETACVAQAVRLDPDVESAACVLTVHNPYDRYLGDVDSELASDLLTHLRLRRDNVLTQMIPLVDGPLSTVSKNFARELTSDPLHTRVFADHVQPLLAERGLVGIDNGIFGQVTFPFSPQAEKRAKRGDFRRVQAEKWERREKLAEVIAQYQRELAQASDPGRQAWGVDLDLSDPGLPVFLVMGRDDPRQKGFDVIAEAIRWIPEGAARYIFTPMPGAEGLVGLGFLKRLADDRPGEVKVFPFRLSFEAFQALQNGSSYMVMGSLYEPFGAANEAYLAGMSVVARATGGLVQQVVPYSQAGLSPYGQGLVASFHGTDAAPTGFLFREPSSPDETDGWRRIVNCAYWNRVPRGDRIADDRKDIPLFAGMVQSAAEALRAAIDLYSSDQPTYARLIYNGFTMLEQFSWDRAIEGYRRLYDRVCD
jgi:glycogen synthase